MMPNDEPHWLERLLLGWLLCLIVMMMAVVTGFVAYVAVLGVMQLFRWAS
jgi:hypothetical protein